MVTLNFITTQRKVEVELTRYKVELRYNSTKCEGVQHTTLHQSGTPVYNLVLDYLGF